MSRGPGKWQRTILVALEENPEGIMLNSIPWLYLPTKPSRADDSACQRAAHRLAKLVRIWCSNSLDVRSAMIAVYSPDALDPEYFAKTRYENNLPTSGPELSDRVIAERLHVSHATVASVRRGKCCSLADYPTSTLMPGAAA
jgi:hypothetical protein